MKRGHGKPYHDRDLDRLKPNERAVLHTYYDTDLSWEQVADALCYSVSRVYQIRRAALDRILSIDRRKKRG
ncbi:MAG: hypothetical protein IJT41_11910 [Clostridia bacterium]|nr:hypothetical protein [Clostridia bacterium]